MDMVICTIPPHGTQLLIAHPLIPEIVLLSCGSPLTARETTTHLFLGRQPCQKKCMMTGFLSGRGKPGELVFIRGMLQVQLQFMVMDAELMEETPLVVIRQMMYLAG